MSSRSEEMSDQEFIGYCEMHSMTERKLFSAEQIGRLAALAGEDIPEGLCGWHSVDLSEWCLSARMRIQEQGAS